MEFVCRRCTRSTNRKPYRVTTEDAGVVLLNMLVCPACARLAKSLGLSTVRMESPKRAKTKEDEAMTGSTQQAVRPLLSIR